jgi:DNA polymerase-3 subunit delta
MLIKYQALPTLLLKEPYPLYAFMGSDPYLLNDAARLVKQSLCQRHECLHSIIDIQSPADWSLLIAEANSYSLLSEYTLLDVRFDKKSIDSTGKEQIVDYLQSVNDRCFIMLRAPLLSTKTLQWLVNAANTIVIPIYPLAASQLKQWINTQLKSQGLIVEPNVVEWIQEHTQGNMLATAQAIEKLSLCTTKNTIITVSMLREQLFDESHFEIYALAEACLEAKAHLVIRLLQQFRQERIEPTLILWILTQEVRLLIQIHYLLKQSISIDVACNQLKIWTSRIQLYAKASARLQLPSLLQLLDKCKQIDEMIKTTQSMQLWNRFEAIALSLCGLGE